MATNSSAIQKKIETLKKGLNNKFITASQKEKIKAQVEKLESQSKALAPKKSTKTATSSSLTRLQKLVKNKKYSVYKGTGVDLKKDSDRPAKAIGKRTSKSGKTYYEYRANRIDVKQPPKKYPKLEKGGYMAEGGEIKFVSYTGTLFNPKEVKMHKTKEEAEERLKSIKGEKGLIPYQNWLLQNKYAKGGKTEKKKFTAYTILNADEYGNRNSSIKMKPTKFYIVWYGNSYQLWHEQPHTINSRIIFDNDNDLMKAIDKVRYSTPNYVNYGLPQDQKFYKEFIVSEKFEYAKGGYMAKGGEMPNSQNLFSLMKLDSKNGNGMLIDGKVYTKKEADLKKDAYEEEMFYNANTEDDMDMEVKIFSVYELLSRKSLPKTTKAKLFSSLQDKQKEIESLTERFADDKYDWKKDYADGGMMAKGGKVDFDKVKTKYATQDINLLQKEGGMAITDTKKGVIFGEHKGGVFSFTTKDGKNLFSGNKQEAIEFVKDNYQVEEMADGGMVFKKGDVVMLKDGGGRRLATIVEDGFDKENRVRIRPEGFPMDISVPMGEEYSDDKRVYVLHKMEKGGYMADGGMMMTEIMRNVTHYDVTITAQPKTDSRNWANFVTFDTRVQTKDRQEAIRKAKLEFYAMYPNEKIIKIVAEPDTSAYIPNMPVAIGFAEGGISDKEVAESNAEMVLSQIKAVKHHAEELSRVVSTKSNIEAWVVGKIERASTDLSDITHYLEGNKDKMSMGGTVRYYAHKMDKK